ncbi:hypothetical protein TCDM_10734 [Trypanosoma cruzi Dm28c]|uniref:Secreted protein n=1 Tax=Trypanosoma cruzi Dm28c TaxID=1416333 RepID=V5D2I2_TRYCR|nr:hypothetical protein TCDM_10734 [Trypanosoma cruzi Dm28c]
MAAAVTGVSFGLASLFSFCFPSCVPAPSAAGSLFEMPSSMLLSASLLAAPPFAVGDGGPDSPWSADVSLCWLAAVEATLFVCGLWFESFSLWTSSDCLTSPKASGLDCPFTCVVAVCVSSLLVGPPGVSFGASLLSFFSSSSVSCSDIITSASG